MTRTTTLLATFAVAMLIALPASAAPPPSTNRGTCTSDVPLMLIVAPQTAGQGGISGDGLSIYNNANDPTFNGGTQYVDGIGGVYVRFQICNGTNDLVINLRGTSPVRYLNLDLSVQLAPADTAHGAVSLTGQQYQQQGEQINEMANSALYTNGQFMTCSGFDLSGSFSRPVNGAVAWYKPTTIYDPVVLDCTSGADADIANQPTNTSPVLVQKVNACTWTVAPMLDTTGSSYRMGIAERVKTSGTTTWVAGGQYQMPFRYEFQELNCTP